MDASARFGPEDLRIGSKFHVHGHVSHIKKPWHLGQSVVHLWFIYGESVVIYGSSMEIQSLFCESVVDLW